MTEEAGIEQLLVIQERAAHFRSGNMSPRESMRGTYSFERTEALMALFAQSEIKELVRKIVGEIRAVELDPKLHEKGTRMWVFAVRELAARLEKEYGL